MTKRFQEKYELVGACQVDKVRLVVYMFGWCDSQNLVAWCHRIRVKVGDEGDILVPTKVRRGSHVVGAAEQG